MRLVFLEAPYIYFLHSVKVILRIHDFSNVFKRVFIIIYEIDENEYLCFLFFFSRRELVTYIIAITYYDPNI